MGQGGEDGVIKRRGKGEKYNGYAKYNIQKLRRNKVGGMSRSLKVWVKYDKKAWKRIEK